MTLVEHRHAPRQAPVPPRSGGVLRLVGPSGLAHLEPTCAGQAAAPLTRLFARQLVTWQAVPDLRDWQAVAPVPDLAVEVPSTYNAGLGASHRCYVFHLRPDVHWDTPRPRPVTAGDFVRGFKRMCNPVLPSPALGWFAGTVRGLAEFAAGWAAATAGTEPTAAELAAYQNAHEIPGVFALDDETLVIELSRPALDFVDLLTLPAASAVPVEYDAYLPDSPQLWENPRSNGPYRVAAYRPGEALQLVRNPVWRHDADPVRRGHPDRIEVRVDDRGPERLAGDLRTGLADLTCGPPLGRSPHPARPEAGRERGWALDPYLLLNLRGPELADGHVRRAVAYAVDKAAVAALHRDRYPEVEVRVAGSLVPPGNAAHQELDPYPTPGDGGDARRARTLLAEAGHPDGIGLTLIHRDADPGPAVARCCADALGRAGITVRTVGLGDAEYERALRHPERVGAGGWQLALATRWPDWLHHNGRAFLQAMVQSTPLPGGANHGGYADPGVDRLIAWALDTIEPWRAEEFWREVERRVLADAAVVPILHRAPVVAPTRAPRVRDAFPLPALAHAVDLSRVWLDGER